MNHHPRTTFRPDIEGLRAVAVASVLLEHAFLAPIGGWTGVDVFFVISGFLITGGMLRAFERDGRLSYGAFLARRACRLLPAAVVVVVVTSGVTAALWLRPRVVGVVLDAVASLSSAENWHLVVSGTSYFATTAPPSPLQHFWSLAVEEQFYASWPLLLVVAVPVGRRLGWSSRRTVGLVAAAIVASSIGWAVLRLGSSATYFDSIARAWELAAGALVAAFVSGDHDLHLPRTLRTIGFCVGLGAIVASAVMADPALGAPVPAAVPAVAGSALVVGLGRGVGVAAAPLTCRMSRWVGRISYPLYLWHLPVLTVAATLAPGSRLGPVVALMVTVVLAALTSRLVEQPALRWGRTRRGRPVERPVLRWRRTRDGPHGAAWLPRALRVLGLLLPSALVIACCGTQLGVPAASDPERVATAAGLVEPLADHAPLPADRLRTAIRAAADRAAADRSVAGRGVGRIPRTTPALDAAYPDQFAPQMRSDTGCRNELTAPLSAARVCVAGPDGSPMVALVVGDSIAMSWVPAIDGALVPLGWQVRAIGFGSCSLVDAAPTPGRPQEQRACAAARERMRAEIRTTHPDLLVVSGDERAFDRLVAMRSSARAGNRWQASTRSMLASAKVAADRVVVLTNPPVGPAPGTCATRLTGVDACATTSSASRRTILERSRAAAHHVGGRVEIVDTSGWFCDHDRVCPLVVDGILTRVDDRHLTNAMSSALASVMRTALLAHAPRVEHPEER